MDNIKNYFNLDSVAGDGDELSKIKRVLSFVNQLIPHDGQNDFHENHNEAVIGEIEQISNQILEEL